MQLAKQLQRVTIDAATLAGHLDATRFASDFKFDELKVLAQYLAVYKAPKGTVVFKQGDRDPYLALVFKGSVRVVQEDDAGQQKTLTIVTRLYTLGEMSLVDQQPRSATAICEEDSILFVLGQEDMQRMQQKDPKIWGGVLLQFCKMLSSRVRALSGEVLDLRK